MSMSRPWEGVTPPEGERVITGAVFSGLGTAGNAYIELITKWFSAPGLPDLDLMGTAYLYQVIKDENGQDAVSITWEVPKEAMENYNTFADWLELIGVNPQSSGFAMYTKSFASDFIT